jgi:hypothetical protein
MEVERAELTFVYLMLLVDDRGLAHSISGAASPQKIHFIHCLDHGSSPERMWIPSTLERNIACIQVPLQ